MDKISRRQSAVLEVLDEQIEGLEQKLEKVQPLINELNRLRQTRRVLLAEKGTTGGGGRSGTVLTQEQVIHYLRENGPSQPITIAQALGVKETTMRSHLNRNRDTTYERNGDGNWDYLGMDEDEDED